MDFHLCASTDLPYEQAMTRVRQALTDHGFGVITEIDMRATLAANTGADIEPYLILAMDPPVLTAFDGTGALSPVARETAERLRAVPADASSPQE